MTNGVNIALYAYEEHTESIMDVRSSFTDYVTVPKRCEGCHHLVRLAEVYENFADEYHDAVTSGLDGSASEKLIENLIEYEGVDPDVAREDVLAHPKEVHESLMRTIDSMEESRDACASVATKMIDACPDGLLRLRARRNGVQVLVSVCMSKLNGAVTEANDNMEMVRIERTYDQ